MSKEATSSSERRLIDANLNRLSEALRTVEDVCRFHWNQREFSDEIKQLRHAVLTLFLGDSLGRVDLIRERDITGDVGRDLESPPLPTTAPSTGEAASEIALHRVAIRNLQRAKETLRSLEEVSRQGRAEQSRAVESWRYRLYSIEKGLLGLIRPPDETRLRLSRARLCLLWTRSLVRDDPDSVLDAALEGGVDVVQMREKDMEDREALARGRELRARTAAHGALLIVNDRADLARLVEADGVHVGQDDLPVHEVRRILGEGPLVGVSTHSESQLRGAIREAADYVGIGPVFPTTTKDAGPSLGVEALAHLVRDVVGSLPSFAIGGIRPDNIGEVARAGARAVAVCGTILSVQTAREAEKVARALRETLADRTRVQD